MNSRRFFLLVLLIVLLFVGPQLLSLRFDLFFTSSGHVDIVRMLQGGGLLYIFALCLLLATGVVASRRRYSSALCTFIYFIVVVIMFYASQYPVLSSWDYFTHGSLSSQIMSTGHIPSSYLYSNWPGTDLLFNTVAQVMHLDVILALIFTAAVAEGFLFLFIYVIGKRLIGLNVGTALFLWALILFLTGPIVQMDASPQLISFVIYLGIVLVISNKFLKQNSYKQWVLLLIFVAGIAISHPVTSILTFSTILLTFFMFPILTGVQIRKLSFLTSISLLIISMAWNAFSGLQSVLLSLTSPMIPSLRVFTWNSSLTGLDSFLSFYRSASAYSVVALAFFGLIVFWKRKEGKLLFILIISIAFGCVPFLFLTSLGLFVQRLFMFCTPFTCMLAAIGLSKIKNLTETKNFFKLTRKTSAGLKVVAMIGLSTLLMFSFVAAQSPPNGYLYANLVHKWEPSPSIFITKFGDVYEGITTDNINMIIFRYYSGQSGGGVTWAGGSNITYALNVFDQSHVCIISTLRLAFEAGSVQTLPVWVNLEDNLTAKGYDRTYDSNYSQIFYRYFG